MITVYCDNSIRSQELMRRMNLNGLIYKHIWRSGDSIVVVLSNGIMVTNWSSAFALLT